MPSVMDPYGPTFGCTCKWSIRRAGRCRRGKDASSKFYQTLKALADAECHGTDMGLVCLSRKDERLRLAHGSSGPMPASMAHDPNAWFSQPRPDAVMFSTPRRTG
jgi:hypothetical protein